MDYPTERWDAVGEAIRARMSQVAMSQADLVRASGVSVFTVRRLERGTPGNYRDANLSKISRALWDNSLMIRWILNGIPYESVLDIWTEQAQRRAVVDAYHDELGDDEVQRLRALADLAQSRVDQLEEELRSLTPDSTRGQEVAVLLAEAIRERDRAKTALRPPMQDAEIGRSFLDAGIRSSRTSGESHRAHEFDSRLRRTRDELVQHVYSLDSEALEDLVRAAAWIDARRRHQSLLDSGVVTLQSSLEEFVGSGVPVSELGFGPIAEMAVSQIAEPAATARASTDPRWTEVVIATLIGDEDDPNFDPELPLEEAIRHGRDLLKNASLRQRSAARLRASLNAGGVRLSLSQHEMDQAREGDDSTGRRIGDPSALVASAGAPKGVVGKHAGETRKVGVIDTETGELVPPPRTTPTETVEALPRPTPAGDAPDPAQRTGSPTRPRGSAPADQHDA